MLVGDPRAFTREQPFYRRSISDFELEVKAQSLGSFFEVANFPVELIVSEECVRVAA